MTQAVFFYVYKTIACFAVENVRRTGIDKKKIRIDYRLQPAAKQFPRWYLELIFYT